MSQTLTGKNPANTYKDLLQVSNNNTGIDGTLRPISDGEGTDSALQVSATAVRATGPLSFAGTDHGGVTLNNLTTTQRNALSANPGTTIFNTTTYQMETFNGTSWVAGGGGGAGAVTSVAGKVGAVTLTASDVSGLASVASTGAYADLSGKPSLGTAAAMQAGSAGGVATLGNDGKVPSAQLPAASNAVTSVAGKTGAVTLTATDVSGLSSVASTGSYNDLSGKPTLFSGAYADLTGKPTLGSAASLTAGAANGVASLGSDGKVPAAQLPAVSSAVTSVAGRTGAVTLTPTDVVGLAVVASTGSYADLSNKPTLGTAAALAAGAANGAATLGSDGKVPSAQLPVTGGSSTLATLLKSSALVPIAQDSTSYVANIDGVANRNASAMTINMLADSFGGQSTYHPTDLDISSYQTWTASTAYVSQEVVKYNGFLFYTNAAGTSGTTPPTPSALNDGGITWIGQNPIASKFGTALPGEVEMRSNGRLRWNMEEGYKAPLFGAAKVFVVAAGNNYVAPYANPINGLRVNILSSGGKVTGAEIKSPGRASGAHVINVLDTGSGSGAVLHVAGGHGTFSASGCLTDHFVVRLPDAIASTTDIIIVGAPNNDITANVATSVTIANIRTCAERLVAAGKKVVLMAQTPSTVHTTVAMKLAVQRYNRWLRDFCSKASWANVNGVCAISLADASGYFCDGATDNLPIGGAGGVTGAMTADGLHPSQRGNQYQGAAVVEACRHWIGTPPTYPSRCYSAFDGYDPLQNPAGNRFEALAWTASEPIIVGQTRSNGGNIYVATAAGTTASSGGPSGLGTSITDGTVTWMYCFPAKMSVGLSGTGGTTSNLTGITVSGNIMKGAQIARASGSATGTLTASIESPWSNGQAGQRQAFTLSLGGGTASERYQFLIFFGAIEKLGMLAADLGVTPFIFETEWEISNVKLLTQFNSTWNFATAGYDGLGSGRELTQSAGEMLPIHGNGKFIHRTQPMIVPLGTANLGIQSYFGFNASGAADSATVTAKLNHFTFRRANVL